ncbi:hypothetical protein SAMN05443270_0425 [Lacrimispora sphenoides]|uniref:hypothetical protein n=1 Tax=Lacrimispora sphenoides TaxID=29370 RepID=UPI0008D55C6D|nr:hypothetical protein [Lacrimispora sphenoides]SET54178.1 hypothetical protein SAMN05443270_0425 [Lacrimispora sphenoides]
MIKYKDKDKFEIYKDDLLRYIKRNDNSYIEFMRKNGNPFTYLEEFRIKNFAYGKLKIQSPYYDEININEITSANSDAILDNNFPRVINSIQYILNDECEPISLIKFKDGYYIENGKHRYFAHVLLGKEKIPASIQITDGIDENINNDMISISRPFRHGLAYPEKALEFFYKYKSMFGNVRLIKMLDDKMIIELNTDDIITFNGCCLSGSDNRSARVTYEIIKQCGYNINIEYIQKHKTFVLEDKNDAHNMNFNCSNDISTVNDVIIPNFKNIIDFLSKEKEKETTLVVKFLCAHKRFNQMPTNLSPGVSSILEIGNKVYYLIVLIGIPGTFNDEESIYIIEGNKEFDNLALRFIATFPKHSKEYKQLVPF